VRKTLRQTAAWSYITAMDNLLFLLALLVVIGLAVHIGKNSQRLSAERQERLERDEARRRNGRT